MLKKNWKNKLVEKNPDPDQQDPDRIPDQWDLDLQDPRTHPHIQDIYHCRWIKT
jgi:hypothetical protein